MSRDTIRKALLATTAGRLIVSCQAYPGEPMRHAETMTQVAESVVRGGAVAIRAQGLDDIALMRTRLDYPIIGLVKVSGDPVFITPTLQDALDVVEAGAEVVAIDGTRRPRPDGMTLAETIAEIHRRTDALVMADAASVNDGLAAERAGADIVGTTLAGHTDERPMTQGPDLDLVSLLAAELSTPVFAEGRIHSPDQAAAALDAGAHAVVVGTAITHPETITSWFVDACENRKAT